MDEKLERTVKLANIFSFLGEEDRPKKPRRKKVRVRIDYHAEEWLEMLGSGEDVFIKAASRCRGGD